LELYFGAADVGLFRSLMRVIPVSCPKIQFLQLTAFFLLGDEDFLRVEGEGVLLPTPPLLQFPGKQRVYPQLFLVINIVILICSERWASHVIHNIQYFIIFAALKGLKICSSSVDVDVLLNYRREKPSVFLTDAVFVKVFSLMQLEYLELEVDNAMVTTRVRYGSVKIVLEYYNVVKTQVVLVVCSFFVVEQLTGKAYAALLEGPFADSILESPFLSKEYRRIKISSRGAEMVDDQHHSLELLQRLKDRVMENRVSRGRLSSWTSSGMDGCTLRKLEMPALVVCTSHFNLMEREQSCRYRISHN
jgi:hypothetical protein